MARYSPAGGASYIARFEIADGVISAIGEAARIHSLQLKALAELLAKGMESDIFEAANTELALGAQRAILGAYDGRRQSGVSGIAYRTRTNDPQNMRYAGGKLRRAIASPFFYETSNRHISIINETLLNKEAKQWHRLNFGAEPRGAGSSGRATVHWSGMLAASFGFDEGPSPAFSIPPGWFVDPGSFATQQRGSRGSGLFYPISGKHPRITKTPQTIVRTSPTRGIVAANFFDAGLRSLAENLPHVYERSYATIFNDATSRATATAGGVHTVRPRKQAFRVNFR